MEETSRPITILQILQSFHLLPYPFSDWSEIDVSEERYIWRSVNPRYAFAFNVIYKSTPYPYYKFVTTWSYASMRELPP